ncbi:glycosyltransferase family 4 protein [Zobellia alginiliquefaciens]|uniref:glycosyltransferase family 4 protein n=1 Tax=Zobellia alginiliquefaciens TaxID=3032586 RepID=UPI0023E442C1|nr:glycosyltransferase family 1 protein [Zobellia alginiliquefaciens]
MKIALESSSLFFKNYTGIPFYIHNLYNSLKDIDAIDPYLAFRLKRKFKKKSDFQKNLLNNKHLWHLNNFALTTTKFDVAHSLHSPFLNFSSSLKVATVHDLAVHLPQFKSYELTTPYFEKKRMALFKDFSKKADVIITVSEATKQDFLSFFNYPEDRIHAIPLAPSLKAQQNNKTNNDLLKEFNVAPKTYFISLGGVSLRKNTLNLIKGYTLSKESQNKKLIITGKIESKHYSPVFNFIKENSLENKIVITGYLSSEKLAALYKNAAAFLFPTFYEGFGIPILEAMLAELPVLTSNTGAAPETSKNHAVLVNPFKPEDIAAGIERLSTITEDQIKQAKQFATTFTWERTAQKTKMVYEKYM